MDRKLRLLLSRKEIADIVKRLAREIDRDYHHQSPTLVGILKGGFMFLADLARRMRTPAQSIEFIRLSSYGSGTNSSGKARVALGLPAEAVRGRDVIVVEDIIDTGITTARAIRYLRSHHPASLKLCALLDKPERRQVDVFIDYLGLTIPNQFIVGYGTDLDQQYRQLLDIYTLEDATCAF